jgi:hypothetical protein
LKRFKLRNFGSSLRSADEQNGWFFHIVFELMDATLSNYHQLRIGYNDNNSALLAWTCRNMLELAIFTKYVLISEANARRFADDRFIDGCDIIISLRTLELHLNPKSNTAPLDAALARMQAKMAAEGVTAKKYLVSGALAESVAVKDDNLHEPGMLEVGPPHVMVCSRREQGRQQLLAVASGFPYGRAQYGCDSVDPEFAA